MGNLSSVGPARTLCGSILMQIITDHPPPVSRDLLVSCRGDVARSIAARDRSERVRRGEVDSPDGSVDPADYSSPASSDGSSGQPPSLQLMRPGGTTQRPSRKRRASEPGGVDTRHTVVVTHAHDGEDGETLLSFAAASSSCADGIGRGPGRRQDAISAGGGGDSAFRRSPSPGARPAKRRAAAGVQGARQGPMPSVQSTSTLRDAVGLSSSESSSSSGPSSRTSSDVEVLPQHNSSSSSFTAPGGVLMYLPGMPGAGEARKLMERQIAARTAASALAAAAPPAAAAAPSGACASAGAQASSSSAPAAPVDARGDGRGSSHSYDEGASERGPGRGSRRQLRQRRSRNGDLDDAPPARTEQQAHDDVGDGVGDNGGVENDVDQDDDDDDGGEGDDMDGYGELADAATLLSGARSGAGRGGGGSSCASEGSSAAAGGGGSASRGGGSGGGIKGKMDREERSRADAFADAVKTGRLAVRRGDLAASLQAYVNPSRPREFFEKLVSRRRLNIVLGPYLSGRMPRVRAAGATGGFAAGSKAGGGGYRAGAASLSTSGRSIDSDAQPLMLQRAYAPQQPPHQQLQPGVGGATFAPGMAPAGLQPLQQGLSVHAMHVYPNALPLQAPAVLPLAHAGAASYLPPAGHAAMLMGRMGRVVPAAPPNLGASVGSGMQQGGVLGVTAGAQGYQLPVGTAALPMRFDHAASLTV